MRHYPELTIDLSSEKPKKIGRGHTIPCSPVMICDQWKYVENDRPWFHVRYHSSVPVGPPDAPARYETLHYMIFHPSDEDQGQPTYLLPHETISPEQLPKIFAFCLEISDSQYAPQHRAEVLEVTRFLQMVERKGLMSSITRLDFLTRQRLPIPDSMMNEDSFKTPDLYDVEFSPIMVRKTTWARTQQRWSTFKTNRDARARESSDQPTG